MTAGAVMVVGVGGWVIVEWVWVGLVAVVEGVDRLAQTGLTVVKVDVVEYWGGGCSEARFVGGGISAVVHSWLEGAWDGEWGGEGEGAGDVGDLPGVCLGRRSMPRSAGALEGEGGSKISA